MEKKCQKYSLDENENLAKLCIKYGKREEDEKCSNRKINLSNPALTRRVSYQKLSGNFILYLPLNQQKILNAIQLARRCYNSYACTNLAKVRKKQPARRGKSFVNVAVVVKLLL